MRQLPMKRAAFPVDHAIDPKWEYVLPKIGFDSVAVGLEQRSLHGGLHQPVFRRSGRVVKTDP